MRLLSRTLAVLGAGTVVLAGLVPAANAGSSESAIPLVNPETGGRYALYDGELIDLSQGWQGATICVEQVDYSMVCYDDEADYRTGEGLPAATEELSAKSEGPRPLAKSDCPSAHLCLWDNREYDTTAGWIQFREAGEKYLEEYGFAERANSFYNNRLTSSYLVDNPEAYIIDASPAESKSNLGAYTVGRGDGKNWNNKINKLVLYALP